MSRVRAVVAGVGNVYRGDDGVGPVVSARVAAEAPSTVRVLSGLDDPLELIEAWEGVPVAIVVDAVVSDAVPGTVHEIDVGGPLPAMFGRLSTHLFSVAQVIELGRTLERMPARLVLIGVEAANVGQGTSLSPAVQNAVDDVIDRVRTLVAESSVPPEETPDGA